MKLTVLFAGVSLFASEAWAGSISNVPGTLDATVVDPAPAFYPHFICASGCSGGSGGSVAQSGAWTVGISNFPTTQTVNGSVSVPGVSTAANQPSLNADGGGLSHITNFPAIQAVSGSVTVAGVSSATPFPIYFPMIPNVGITGSTSNAASLPTSSTNSASINFNYGWSPTNSRWDQMILDNSDRLYANIGAAYNASDNGIITHTANGALAANQAPLTGAGTSASSAAAVQGVTGGVPIPVTLMDGADTALGSKADPASGTGSASVVALLKQIHMDSSGSIAPGSNTIGATGPAPYSTTDASGTIASGGVFQTVFALNSSRHGCTIQNPTTATEILYVHADTGTATSANSFTIPAGGTFNCAANGIVITDLVSVTGATTGHAFVAKSQ